MPLIVGGSNVLDNKQYPFIVKLPSGCSGAIIDKRWVLTAAHCEKGIYSVIAGENLLSKMKSSKLESYAQRRGLDERISHPHYKRKSNPILSTIEYDFQLLKLSKDFDLNSSNIKKIRIASRGNSKKYLVENELFKVIGWGATVSSGHGYSNSLKELEVPFIPYNESNQPKAYAGLINDKTMITAGFMSGGQDACHGDSGGPFFKNVNGEDILFGVVSGGKGCARENKPGVYARVESALDWIKETIESEYECQDNGAKISVFFYKSKKEIKINIDNKNTSMNYLKTKRGNLIYKNINGPSAKVSKDKSYIEIKISRSKRYSCSLEKYKFSI